jgi:PAS domain S-box-containing protein
MAEQARERETLQAIFDNIPVMISTYDPAGRLLSVNREWERTLGWTFDEARATDILSETYPDPARREEVLAFIRTADRQWKDFAPRTRSGEILDSSWTRFQLSDGSRVGIGIDRTEGKRARAALADAEDRFAKAFQASPAALALSTIDGGRILDVNERWLETFGYTRSEAIGRTHRDLHINVDPRARAAASDRVREDGVVRDLDLQVRTKSGETRDLTVSAVRISAGGEDCWISSHIDVTDRKRATGERDRLYESERAARAEAEAALERLRAIESITDGALRHLGLDELLDELLARLQRALETDSATVLLLEDAQTLYPRAGHGYVLDHAVRVRVGAGVSGMIAKTGEPVVCDDYSTVDIAGIEGIPKENLRAVASIMGVPLRIGKNVMGVVVVSSHRPRRFSAEELRLLGLVADRVAPAVELARMVERVRGGRERQKILARRLLTAQEEERRRLAMELHDELGQVLTAIKINLGSLERWAAALAAGAPRHLSDALASVDQAMQTVRDLALDLRPSVLDDLGLAAALRWYADRFARGAGFDMRVSIDPFPPLPPELETACFRVAQEALTNVARHAQAHRVGLDLKALPEGIELSVRDDGIGFDVAAAREHAISGASMGLLGMQERVLLVGGELDISSPPGGGTWLRARFGTGDTARDGE